MASSYALPASAIHHSHHGNHMHSQSVSHSPRGHTTNHARSLKQERANGSLHGQAQSESHLPHIHEHGHEEHDHHRDSSPYLPSTHKHDARSPSPSPYVDDTYEPAPLSSYQNPLSVKVHAHDDHGYNHDHDHDHHHGHNHSTATSVGPRSRFTTFLLPFVLRWPLVHTIMADKDSRRIFYFMSLNFAFMIVQATYGFLTDSLGLLSDSIHMFFDCLALSVGLFASVASKWPASERFPYGFGKIESLSGFGNAVFLMLISIEIITEATERLAEGRETKRLMELFVVSSLGLAVNLVGMAAFGHHGHHHGHDHSHSHDHGHGGHNHGHSHSGAHHHEGHNHHDNHDHDHDIHTSPFLDQKPAPIAHSHAPGGHSHDNENMVGIYLHVLADTMGSAAVIVSTALIYFTGWNGWDPLASCVIAILIFMSSIPLLKSSAKNLLLTVPDTVEYNLRDALGGVAELRGVQRYLVPRFWLGDKNVEKDSQEVQGVIHIVATRGSDLEEVRERTRAYLLSRGMDAVVQVEKEGDFSCWCGSGKVNTTHFG